MRVRYSTGRSLVVLGLLRILFLKISHTGQIGSFKQRSQLALNLSIEGLLRATALFRRSRGLQKYQLALRPALGVVPDPRENNHGVSLGRFDACAFRGSQMSIPA
jgi:hypothetical protein